MHDMIAKLANTARYTPEGLEIALDLHTTVRPPIPWNQRTIEQRLHVVLPPDLQTLWNNAAEVRLFEDMTYGQWGLVLLSSVDAISQTLAFRDERSRDVLDGDVVIGIFLGDLELLVVRCDVAASDYGKVIVAREIDHRIQWPIASDSLTTFIATFIEHDGVKYWETPAQ